MSRSFTKLFSSITESTVWCEPAATRLCWITMLAMADRHGRVWASVPGLANRARISIEETEAALKRFLAPDPYSRTPDREGRRIESIDDGWRLLNYAKYRALRDEEAVKESKREYMRRVRSSSNGEVEGHVHSGTALPQAEAEAEAEAGKSNPLSGLQPDDAPAGRVDPKAKARREARAIAKRAIEYLNAKAGTKFKVVEANIKLPAARVLQDGATEQDLRAVVDLKLAEAERGDFDRKYLRPATLFKAEKFAQYIGQVGAQAPSAPKPGEPMKVYGEDEAGKQHFITECPPGKPEDVARRVFGEYRGAPWMRNVRNIVTRANGVANRFTRQELSQ